MNKADLVAYVEEHAKAKDFACHAAAERAVNNVLAGIRQGIVSDGTVQLVNFGSFMVRDSAAHMRKNPQTGEPIEVPACRKVKFSTGRALKEAVNAQG